MADPIFNQAWEDVADDVTGAIEKAVQPLLKKAVDDIYGGLLEATQDYLKDNVAFNIASRISTAEREAAGARAMAKILADELGVVASGLHMLRRAIDEGDPRPEIFVRIDDMQRDCRAAIAKATGQ